MGFRQMNIHASRSELSLAGDVISICLKISKLKMSISLMFSGKQDVFLTFENNETFNWNES